MKRINGNLITKTEGTTTTSYEYDYENRLTKITLPDGSTNTFTYCPLGKRIAKTTKDGTTTLFLYDGDNILAEYDPQGNLKTRYTFGPGIDNPISMRTGTQSYFYSLDGLGSSIGLSDNTDSQVTSYSYDVFGLSNSQSPIPNPFLFTSREYEPESDLYYYRARYYDPEVGRFMSTDPILRPSFCQSCPQGATSFMKGAGLLGYGGISKEMLKYPWSLHLYVYVQNNPVNWVDPLGLSSCEDKCDDFRNACYTAAAIAGGASISVCRAICVAITKAPYFCTVACAIPGRYIQVVLESYCYQAYLQCTNKCKEKEKDKDECEK